MTDDRLLWCRRCRTIRDFEPEGPGAACTTCGTVLLCSNCGKPIPSDKYATAETCSERCRGQRWRRGHARTVGEVKADLVGTLARLPDDELRRVLRDAMETREPDRRGRLRVRFGEEGQPPGTGGRS